uniref:Uncharacterized protein C1494.07 n=1 Tax=Cacopsylla melanoneura TaxID=428564 RepID=A0A8D8PNK8_9HEMI
MNLNALIFFCVHRHKGTSEPFQLPDFMHNYIAQYKQLYTFLMRNLADGSNYQRLITTLNLLNILFENMQVHITENQKKKRKPTIEYLKQIGQWDFESAECRERLFSCLKDDTTDVRLMARQVLQSYFSYSNSSEEIALFVRNIQTSLQMSQSNVFYTAESGAYCVAVLVNLYYKSEFNGTPLSGLLTEVLNASKETNGFDVSQYDGLCEKITSLSIVTESDTASDSTAATAAVTKSDSTAAAADTTVGTGTTVGAGATSDPTGAADTRVADGATSATGPDQSQCNFFSTYFLNQCLTQSNQLQKDILLAVKNKNALHGSLTTLMLILTDPSSPEYCGLNSEQVQCLLNLLNETCLYMLDILCMKSKSTNFAPSFGEMGEAMDSLINNMTEGDGESDTLTLTPAHQTLFNCIWMNLKICCTFASELTVAYHGTGLLRRDQIVFSCGIVSHVLHKCRHKGAIQNAGLALAHIVSKCLYDDTYPLDLLKYTLTSVLDCTIGGTVSRKSAGVAILVHKLLASNHSMKDVLFTTAMDKIIQVANSHVESTVETLKVDLPQAVAFHMLQFLVADSGLRVAMATYLEQITMLSFDKMQSQEWTVRNAALQVFGALLPKLVGTKKQDSENQSSNVAFEEFFYQLPRIGDCLRSVLSLSSLHDGNTSVLVSALTLLSRLKTTGHLFPSQQIVDLKHFLNQVYSTMLSSNIYTIRFLVANAYVNTLGYDEFLEQFQTLLFSCLEFIFGSHTLMAHFKTSEMKLFLQNKSRHKIINENHLHATLLALENLKETIYLENVQLDRTFLLELLSFLSSDVPCTANIKFSTYSLLFKIFRQENESLAPKMYMNNTDLFSSVSCLLEKSIKRDIGWKLYAQEVIKFHMSNSVLFSDNIVFDYIVQLVYTFRRESDILADTLVYLSRLLEEYNVKTNEKSLLDSSNNKCTTRNSTQQAQSCIRSILTTVVRSKISRIGLEKIFNLVVQLFIMFVDDKHLSTLVDTEFLNVMDILLEIHFSGKKSDEFEYMCPVILPVVSICIVFAGKDNKTPEVEELLKNIPYFSNIFIYNEACNEEFRYNAALSMSILCEHSLYRSLYGKDVVTNIIHLLQDEVYEVRQEITYFVRHLQRSFSKNSTNKSSLLLTNPYVCLFEILNTNFTYYIDSLTLLDIFSNILFINDQDIDQVNVDSEFCNPFDHNLRNFYSEPIVIVKHAKTLVSDILSATQFDKDVVTELIVKYDACIERYSKTNLNQQGIIKLELMKEVALSLKSVSIA